MNFSAVVNGDHQLLPIRTLHQHTQSVGATGGVYKGQGRNRRRLFLVCAKHQTTLGLSGRLLCLPPKDHFAMGTDYILSYSK